MNEQARRRDNGMCFDNSNIPLLYTVALYATNPGSGEARCPACPAEHDIQNFK